MNNCQGRSGQKKTGRLGESLRIPGRRVATRRRCLRWGWLPRHTERSCSRWDTVDQVVHDYGDLCQPYRAGCRERRLLLPSMSSEPGLNRCSTTPLPTLCLRSAPSETSTSSARTTRAANLRLGLLVHELVTSIRVREPGGQPPSRRAPSRVWRDRRRAQSAVWLPDCLGWNDPFRSAQDQSILGAGRAFFGRDPVAEARTERLMRKNKRYRRSCPRGRPLWHRGKSGPLAGAVANFFRTLSHFHNRTPRSRCILTRPGPSGHRRQRQLWGPCTG